MVIEYINTGIGFIQQGLNFIRVNLTKLVSFLPLDPQLSTTIIFLLFSLWLGGFIAKKFTTKPFSLPYLIYTILISVSIYLNLMYL